MQIFPLYNISVAIFVFTCKSERGVYIFFKDAFAGEIKPRDLCDIYYM